MWGTLWVNPKPRLGSVQDVIDLQHGCIPIWLVVCYTRILVEPRFGSVRVVFEFHHGVWASID